jgi:hypothetical protein
MAFLFAEAADYISIGTLDAPRTGALALRWKPTAALDDGVEHVLFRLAGDADNYLEVRKGSDDALYAGWVVAGVSYRIILTHGNYTLTTGVWNSIVLVWDETAVITRLYCNGVEDDTEVLGGLPVSTTGWTGTIGNTSSAGTSGADGSICDVALWSEVRSAADADDLSDNDAAAFFSGAADVGYWKLIGNLEDSWGSNDGSSGDTVTVSGHAPLQYPGTFSGLGNFLINAWLNHLAGIATFTPTTPLWVAWCKSQPLSDEDGSDLDEPSGGGYARTSLTALLMNTAAARTISNAGTVSSVVASGLWGDITHFAIVNAETVGTGDLYMFGPLLIPVGIDEDESIDIAAGLLTVRFDPDAKISDYCGTVLLNHTFSKSTMTMPQTWLALTTVTMTPTITGSTLSEVGNGYARLEIEPADWVVAAGEMYNDLDTIMAEATGSWGAAPGAAVLVDAATTGNVLMWGPINAKTFDLYDRPIFAAGELVYALS